MRYSFDDNRSVRNRLTMTPTKTTTTTMTATASSTIVKKRKEKTIRNEMKLKQPNIVREQGDKKKLGEVDIEIEIDRGRKINRNAYTTAHTIENLHTGNIQHLVCSTNTTIVCDAA